MAETGKLLIVSELHSMEQGKDIHTIITKSGKHKHHSTQVCGQEAFLQSELKQYQILHVAKSICISSL